MKTKPYLLYFNKCSSLLHDSAIRLLTTARADGKQGHEFLFTNNEFINATKRRKKRGGGGIQTTRYTKMKIQSWSMLVLNYLTFGGGDKFEMAPPHTIPPHPRQTSGLLAAMTNH